MASSIAPTVPADGCADVRIDGPAAWPLGIRTIEITPLRLRLVRALPQTDQILPPASPRKVSGLTVIFL